MRRIGFPAPRRVTWQGAPPWRHALVGLGKDKKAHNVGRIGCVLSSVDSAVGFLTGQLATPLTVQARGLAARPPVWTPDRPAAARIGRLVRAQGLRCDDLPIGDDGDDVYTELDTATHRRAIIAALEADGVALLWVDTDLTDDDPVGKHWVCAFAAEVDDDARGIVGVVHITDSATAGGSPTADGLPAGIEGLDLRTLSGCVMWGSRPRAYAVRAVRPIHR